MLKEFRVHNFKLLLNVTFSPGSVNLLIGKNNTGKTSLCQAMKFLSLSSFLDLKLCAEFTSGIPQGLPHIRFSDEPVKLGLKALLSVDGIEYTFDYDLSIQAVTIFQEVPQLQILNEKLIVSGGRYSNTILLFNDAGDVKLLDEVKSIPGNDIYVDTNAPREASMLKALFDAKTNKLAHFFKSYLNSWHYYCLNPLQIRSLKPRPDDFFLNEDGSNLTSMLHKLKNMNELDYRKLLDKTRMFDPSIDAMNFISNSEYIFMAFADSNDRRVIAQNSSDGTLRFIAMLFVLMIQPKITGIPSIVMIEEPENGIYVGALRELVELAENTTTNTQVVFTSHSPYLIDLFDNKLDDVFVMKRDETHAFITKPDKQIVEKYLDEHPLGELHFQEML